jgi:hypothetical protein
MDATESGQASTAGNCQQLMERRVRKKDKHILNINIPDVNVLSHNSAKTQLAYL